MKQMIKNQELDVQESRKRVFNDKKTKTRQELINKILSENQKRL